MDFLKREKVFVVFAVAVLAAVFVMRQWVVGPAEARAEALPKTAKSALLAAQKQARDFYAATPGPEHPSVRTDALKAKHARLLKEIAYLTERAGYEPASLPGGRRFVLPRPEAFAALVRSTTGRETVEPADYKSYATRRRNEELRQRMGQSEVYRSLVKYNLTSPTIEDGSEQGFNFDVYTQALGARAGETETLAQARARAAMRLRLLNLTVNIIEIARSAHVHTLSRLRFQDPGTIAARFKADRSKRYRPIVVSVTVRANEVALWRFVGAALSPEKQGALHQALTLEEFTLDNAERALLDDPPNELVDAELVFVAFGIDPKAPFGEAARPDRAGRRPRGRFRRRSSAW